MCVYLRAKFELSSISVTSFRHGGGSGIILPPPPPQNKPLNPPPPPPQINISRSKDNEAMKFGQLIKYGARNIILQKSCRK